MPAPLSKHHYSDKTELGAGRQMWSDVALSSNGLLTGTTRTRAYTWFGGWTGGVYVIVVDPWNVTLDVTKPIRSFGVNGTAFGGSDRTDVWSYQFSQDVADNAANLRVVHMYTPTSKTAKWIKDTVEQAAGASIEDTLIILLRGAAGQISISG